MASFRLIGCVCLAALLSAPAVLAHGLTEEAAEHNLRGVEHYNAGQWERAIDAFYDAHELAPDNATVRRNLCNAYQAYANTLAQGGDFETAAEVLKYAIDADPGNASPLVQLGSYNLRLDRLADAIFRLEEAVELAPEDEDALELLGDAYYRSNDLRLALDVWYELQDLAPNRPGLQDKIEKATREATVEHNFRRSGSRHFDISYPPGTTGREQNEVLSILERAYREIGRKLGNAFPTTPIQVIIYSAEEFSEATQLGEHVGAVYDGKIRVPVRNAEGGPIDSAELERRLFHEYTHVVVRHLAGERVPWWLNEGLAETFSKELTDADYAGLRQAEMDDGLFVLSDLDASQLHAMPPHDLRLAYVQSHATVDYLWRRFGQRSLLAYLDALSEGVEPEEAMRQVYRRTYLLLEREVSQEIRRRAP